VERQYGLLHHSTMRTLGLAALRSGSLQLLAKDLDALIGFLEPGIRI